MNMPPVVAALRKHKASVVLVVLEIALTLAIVSNAIFIIAGRVERVNRPTGLDENNLLWVNQQWVGAPTGTDQATLDKLDSMQLADLATLRQIPGVTNVTPIVSMPLSGNNWSTAIAVKPAIVFKDKSSYNQVGVYFADADGLATLGLKLVAGRNFRPSEIAHTGFRTTEEPAAIIITRALADKMYPGGHALGKVGYLDGKDKPATIIGIVARMQTAGLGSFADGYPFSSVLVPRRLDGASSAYAIRTRPGEMDAVRKAIEPALYKTNPMRVMDDDSIKSFHEIRADAYKGDIGMAILMGVICVILILVTAGGIVGLTSFWVGQRRKQIGVRRALGATQRDILRYFQTENLLIAGTGVVVGAVLAVALNLELMRHFQMQRMSLLYVLVGVVALLLLGQGAVFAPALRASRVSPVEATRSV